MAEGLTESEWKLFSDLIIKANDIQVREMRRIILIEPLRRVENKIKYLEELNGT